ncbi:hypothetical protein BCR37DRAFT_393131 [Protomyces lactucae-debilis]|uniref:Uncharacterized protein n=1 Tax=Protomyces lactucae-debilis TaxID=2754530 RepID=A0A1Y2FFN1_PROLT|nr:uncharacterized protein BCR37DRAFT_393131 [Protomyces lactucae-debilis]ORY82096.1 hypothetical protein BCR37DRAFT_393131 [Protomyces lactucae-debilis]
MASIFDKFFGTRKDNIIEVSHGKDRYEIDFLPGSIESGSATVGDLRQQCTEITKTPANHVKLLFRGKILGDDAVKLVSVGMKSGSKVLCMATREPLAQQPGNVDVAAARQRQQALEEKKKEEALLSPLEQLNALLAGIERDLAPQVEMYTGPEVMEAKQRKEQHDMLAELLLQKLFALDGIVSRDDAGEGDREALRKRRKEGVQYTQGLLDRVDDVVRVAKLQEEAAE